MTERPVPTTGEGGAGAPEPAPADAPLAPEDDAVIGTCTLARLDATHGIAEVGFALARDSWRRGYMKEALPLLVDFAFSRLGLRRLEADVDPRNVASLRLLERLGFRREGLLRERYCMNAELQDAVLLALLGRDWRGQI